MISTWRGFVNRSYCIRRDFFPATGKPQEAEPISNSLLLNSEIPGRSRKSQSCDTDLLAWIAHAASRVVSQAEKRRATRDFTLSAEGLSTMPDNMRGAALEIMPIWRISSLGFILSCYILTKRIFISKNVRVAFFERGKGQL